jgi:hypothetical protein
VEAERLNWSQSRRRDRSAIHRTKRLRSNLNPDSNDYHFATCDREVASEKERHVRRIVYDPAI